MPTMRPTQNGFFLEAVNVSASERKTHTLRTRIGELCPTLFLAVESERTEEATNDQMSRVPRRRAAWV
jgi:hypothetical protein